MYRSTCECVCEDMYVSGKAHDYACGVCMCMLVRSMHVCEYVCMSVYVCVGQYI